VFNKLFIKPFKYGEKGFTLIEMLIVIAVLGVLSAVLVPNVSGFIKSGNISGANAEASAVKTAVQAYIADGGTTDPITHTEYDDYVTGTSRAYYTISATTGEISAVVDGTGEPYPASIVFDISNKAWRSKLVADVVTGRATP
jgi:type IV pilus assembly protein PilA